MYAWSDITRFLHSLRSVEIRVISILSTVLQDLGPLIMSLYKFNINFVIIK